VITRKVMLTCMWSRGEVVLKKMQMKIVEQLPLSARKCYKYISFNVIDSTKFSIQSRFEKCL